MKIHMMAQGSQEWTDIRLGIPTASCFDRIITPAKGDFSKSARPYAFQLVAEAILRQPPESLDHVAWVDRGRQLEPLAVQHYAFANDLDPEDVRTVGFITLDDGTAGCSPDRLTPNNGGLEVKCPAPNTHIAYHIDGVGDAYKVQLQAQMFIAELDHVDFFSWHPEMPPYRLRIGRDESYIEKLECALRQFTDIRLTILEKCRQIGFFALARPRLLMGNFEHASGSLTQTHTDTARDHL